MAIIFRFALSFFFILSADASVFGEDIKTIHIATPLWEGQTNKDGTGLFFDLVRTVYESEGIRMEYQIVPWKRAELMVSHNDADAMLCVVRQNISSDMRIPKYPMAGEYTAAIFKKEKIGNWKGRETLEGRDLIWMRGYDFHKNPHLKGLKLTWDEVNKHSNAWKRLDAERKADIFIDSVADITAYVKSNDIDMNIYGMKILWGEDAYMAFAKSEKSKKLIEIYDRRILELHKSGELRKLFEKWDSYVYLPEAWKDRE